MLPPLLRLLPAGAVAGWALHPLESAAFHGAHPLRTFATAGGLWARVDVPMAATMIDLIAVLGHLVTTPRRQAMTDPQHALTAIDIALEPDAVMMSRAFADNAALRENVPQGFALDATHHAHITLLQRFVRTADLPSIYAATETVLAKEKYTDWKLTAFKYYYVPAGPIGLAGIVVEPTTDLIRLQQQIIDAVAPYTAN